MSVVLVAAYNRVDEPFGEELSLKWMGAVADQDLNNLD